MFKKAFLGTEHFLHPLVLALLSSFLYCFTENPVCDPPASTSFLWQAKPWITPCDAAAGHWLAAYVSWWHLISIFGINLYCFLICWLIKDKLLWRDFMWWINLNAVDVIACQVANHIFCDSVCHDNKCSSHALQVGTVSVWPVLSLEPSIILNLFPLCQDFIFPQWHC